MSESKQAVIILGHGSRLGVAENSMSQVAVALADKYGYQIVGTCYMSKQAPSLEEALDDAVKQGATDVVVAPYFLHLGVHMQEDIPKMLERYAAKYPGLSLQLAAHLGFDEKLVDLVHKRVAAVEGS